MRALDVCAGAGGLSLGLHNDGFDVLGVELDCDAWLSHRENVGPCRLCDLRDFHPEQRYELTAGGVPCQPFSLAGDGAGLGVANGRLYEQLIRIGVEADSDALLIENVPGLLARQHGNRPVIEVVTEAMREAGYSPIWTVLDAAAFGVPQRRKRLFIAGFRDAAALAAFRWPEPTHGDPSKAEGLLPWVTVREALGLGGGGFDVGRREGAKGWQGERAIDVDCPASRSCSRGNPDKLSPLDRVAPTITAKDHDTGRDARRPGRRPIEGRDSVPQLSDRPSPTVVTRENCSALQHGRKGATTAPRRAGDTLNPALADLLDQPAHCVSAGGTHGGGGAETFPNAKYRAKLSAELEAAGILNRPGTTIAADPRMPAAGHHNRQQKGAVRLSLGDLAILQGFPPGFRFAGNVTSQHKQVGNAVPPKLGEVVGRSVKAALLAARKEAA